MTHGHATCPQNSQGTALALWCALENLKLLPTPQGSKAYPGSLPYASGAIAVLPGTQTLHSSSQAGALVEDPRHCTVLPTPGTPGPQERSRPNASSSPQSFKPGTDLPIHSLTRT